MKEYFNTAAFVPATLGTFGNIGRNSLRGPGYADVDASIFKDFLQAERIHAQFRAEAFNTLNEQTFPTRFPPFPQEHTDRSRQLIRRVSSNLG